ncbi:MAG: hypothetical protein J3Q66DRAFT_175991 [Benniella sp.]|nr:MAG: hypothetical protein J3Q66DRAFT_175991 [Benniella sp.]
MAALVKREPGDLAFIGHSLFPAQRQHRASPKFTGPPDAPLLRRHVQDGDSHPGRIRICLDILKGPPKRSWNPAISIATMLPSLKEFYFPTPTQMILCLWILRVSIRRTRGVQ